MVRKFHKTHESVTLFTLLLFSFLSFVDYYIKAADIASIDSVTALLDSKFAVVDCTIAVFNTTSAAPDIKEV